MTKVLAMITAAVLLTACSESTPPLPPSIRTIHVSASTSDLVLGDSVEVRATATAADGSTFSLTTVGWTSDNVAVATVMATGPLTAEVRTISAGSVTITATVESHSGQLALAVTAPAEPPPPPPPPLETSPWMAFIWSRETGMMALTFPPGVGATYASSINDLGQVVGSVHVDDNRAVHAFVWTLEAGMTDIGGLPGYVVSYATAINNAGEVVGGSEDASGHRRAFRWSPSEGMIALPMPPGTESSYALGINAGGEIVGERNGSAGLIPFRWSKEKGTEDLTLVGSDSYGAAMAIADNGDVVGYSGGSNSDGRIQRAVLWTAAGAKRIIDACTGGSYSWIDYSYECSSSANAINSAGQITGTSESAGSPVAFRLTLDANRQFIPDIPGSSMSYPRAMNEAGQVVGSSNRFVVQVGEVGRAFLWSSSGGTIDLGALPGRQWSQATGINNRGQVVGSSY